MPRRLIPFALSAAILAAGFGALGGQLVAGVHRQSADTRTDTTLRNAALFLRDGHYIPPQP